MKNGERRTLLKAALGAGLGVAFVDGAAGQGLDPREPSAQRVGAPTPQEKSRPQPDDRLGFAFGARQGQAVASEDLIAGAPPVFAYPMDRATGTPRDGSRLNLVLLIRLPSEELLPTTRALAADGIVAYSAVCTHTGCDVSDWDAAAKVVVCSCHDSAFDPREAARVLGGPARRRLPALPLKQVDGVLLVAGGFTGRVGGDKQ